MKKFLFILIPVVVIAAFFIFGPKNQKTQVQIESQPTPIPVDTLIADMTSEFSKKYNKSESDIVITTQSRTEKFAKGLINFKDEPGGAVWFAAKNNGSWNIVHDGNGIINCDQLKDHQDFPNDLIPSCFDSNTKTLLTR